MWNVAFACRDVKNKPWHREPKTILLLGLRFSVLYRRFKKSSSPSKSQPLRNLQKASR
jgi:hypothetical protein